MSDFTTLCERDLGLTPSRQVLESLLREPAPEEGRPFTEVLVEFRERIATHTLRVSHPRFLAFVPSSPTFLSVLGDMLADASHYFAGNWRQGASSAEVELIVLDWFKAILGCPPGTAGVLTSGGSEANLTALVVARERLSWDERRRAVLYVSEQRHNSIDRSTHIMGLRPEQVRPVPTDDEFRLRTDALAEMVREDRATGRVPWAVVANGGATNTGTVDPLAELSRVCRDEKLWLHVDAAYGWVAALTDVGRSALAGIGEADSITLDPHKWFAQVYESGCVLVRDGHRLEETFTQRADYLRDVIPGEEQVNFADRGLALTRRFRALKIWLSVKVLGLAWHRRLVEHCTGLAEFTEALLRQSPSFEVLCPARLSTVCFRYAPSNLRDEESLNQLNLALIDELRATRQAVLSSTRLRGRVALRACFINWRTTAGDVEMVLRLIEELGQRLAGRGMC